MRSYHSIRLFRGGVGRYGVKAKKEAEMKGGDTPKEPTGQQKGKE